jgi:nitrite reductase/ring-hydroxylating ferredoxin subunit
MNRRSFIIQTTGAISLVVLQIRTAGQTTAPSRETRVDIGSPSDFPANSVTDRFAARDGILVAHQSGRVYAMTSICTHRKGSIELTEGRLQCASHGSVFDITGRRVAGPAKDALVRYAISLDSRGKLVVDKSCTFDESAWNDAASFFAVSTDKS